MIIGVVKDRLAVTIFYSFDCEGCENCDCFEVSYKEYHSLSDMELMRKYT